VISYLLYFDLLASSALQWSQRRATGFAGRAVAASGATGTGDRAGLEGPAAGGQTLFVSATDAT
jgi:hypothetical protein